MHKIPKKTDKQQTYLNAGVDVEKGEFVSKMFYEAAKKTFENRKGDIGEIFLPFDDFSGVRAIDISKLPKGSLISMGFDGIGTKVEIAQRMNNHTTIAYDLFAMVCDDAIVRGAEPVLLGSVLDVNSLNMDALKQLSDGYIKAAKAANVAVINGEIAELGSAVGGYGRFKYNWCSGVVWFANKKKLFTGKQIKPGDSLVVLQEKGFRSNGLSLVRKVFGIRFGKRWHKTKFEGNFLGDIVLTPSTIYSKVLVHMHGGFCTEGNCEIHGVVHITGGGIPEKLGRVLKPSGLGAELNNLYEPCKVMKYCQKLGTITDKKAYQTWNMGQGLVIITPQPQKVEKEAKKFGIDAKIAGKIINKKIIKIKSNGLEGKELEFKI